MSEKKSSATAEQQTRTIRNYYQLQSRIYDLTRWSFLFGRREIIRRLPFDTGRRLNCLEIGCGTGYNLKSLARQFPNARLTGIDVSADMLQIARKELNSYQDRVELIEKPYALGDPSFHKSADLILFSYALTMINPQWEELIDQARRDLKKGGYIAVADFHDSRFRWFKNHMSNHHVRMDGHLLPVLEEKFSTEIKEVNNAYGGVWEYCLYVGQK